MKIMTVLGARPQFIKAGPVSSALRGAGIEEFLLHTGQHYDHELSQVFFDELGLAAPAINLGVGSGTHAEQTARMLVGVEQAIDSRKPDVVLVYGDTNSTLAGALAASKLHVPVAHVEAGLRSFNRRMPEEINRVVTDMISDILFAPTRVAAENLAAEGVPADRIHLVGDVMYDSALINAGRADRSSSILRSVGVESGRYVLMTVHRAENTDDSGRLRAIVEGLAGVSRDRTVVWPMHPRTRAALVRNGLWELASRNLTIIDPVGYLDMVMLEKSAALIATDSGGVQKEAFFYRIPCVTMRDETEWTETVEMGWNHLAPPSSKEAVAESVIAHLGDRGSEGDPYGGGKASVRISEVLRDM